MFEKDYDYEERAVGGLFAPLIELVSTLLCLFKSFFLFILVFKRLQAT